MAVTVIQSQLSNRVVLWYVAPWYVAPLFIFLNLPPFPIFLFFNLLCLSASDYFLKLIFNWSIVDLQCCVRFCCIAKWISHTYTHIQASQVVLAIKNLPAMQEPQKMQVRSLSQEDSPGGGHGNLLQCSCLENPKYRGAWWVHRVAKSQIQVITERKIKVPYALQ